ncbi:unnamed protein product [Phaedon cochleariae]|uniref:Uncharacterized protein n=1 Tax=Phaedon cochleariae TaxID=80249 RepID=A0A9P0GSA7_PHACE|nr:unnamed protein product [Phaedon cochleariae]
MKLFIVSLFFVIGLCHAELYEEGSSPVRGALKRVVRHAIGGMGGEFLTQTELSIISNCKANGYGDEVGDRLQESYDKLKVCIRKKTMFIDPKEDYIANLEECAQDPIKKTTACLREDQKYFPQFLLDLSKSVVIFMYDDFNIMRVDLPRCIIKFQEYRVQRKYLQCLMDTSQKTHDTMEIPSSKESFCEKFIPASRCFTEIIKDNCDQTPKLVQFREDYMNSMMRPCGLKSA